MNATPISQVEKATNIPDGSLYLVEMGDGSGTKTVTQETLIAETGKTLKIGNMDNLKTINKESLVEAINEAAQSGGGGTSAPIDILDTKEEIEANTEAGKVAGALAVKEIASGLNNSLGGCSLVQEGNDFYIVGADAVRKKLGDTNLTSVKTADVSLTGSNAWGKQNMTKTITVPGTFVAARLKSANAITSNSPSTTNVNILCEFFYSYNADNKSLTINCGIGNSDGLMTYSPRAVVTYLYIQ